MLNKTWWNRFTCCNSITRKRFCKLYIGSMEVDTSMIGRYRINKKSCFIGTNIIFPYFHISTISAINCLEVITNINTNLVPIPFPSGSNVKVKPNMNVPLVELRTKASGYFCCFFKMAGKIVIFCSSASKNRIFIGLMVLLINISSGKIMGKSNIFVNYVKYVKCVHFPTKKRSHHM